MSVFTRLVEYLGVPESELRVVDSRLLNMDYLSCLGKYPLAKGKYPLASRKYPQIRHISERAVTPIPRETEECQIRDTPAKTMVHGSHSVLLQTPTRGRPTIKATISITQGPHASAAALAFCCC